MAIRRRKAIRYSNPYASCERQVTRGALFVRGRHNAWQDQELKYKGSNYKIVGCGTGKSAKLKAGKLTEGTYAMRNLRSGKIRYAPKRRVRDEAYHRGGYSVEKMPIPAHGEVRADLRRAVRVMARSKKGSAAYRKAAEVQKLRNSLAATLRMARESSSEAERKNARNVSRSLRAKLERAYAAAAPDAFAFVSSVTAASRTPIAKKAKKAKKKVVANRTRKLYGAALASHRKAAKRSVRRNPAVKTFHKGQMVSDRSSNFEGIVVAVPRIGHGNIYTIRDDNGRVSKLPANRMDAISRTKHSEGLVLAMSRRSIPSRRGKLTGAAKQEFLDRMAAGRRRAAR